MPNAVLYLAGLGRSGSTLLERMVGELDGVCPAGEIVHLWHRGIQLDEACGCGEPFSRCDFWAAVGDEAFGGWGKVPAERIERTRRELDRSRRIPAMLMDGLRPRFAAELRHYTDNYAAVYDAIRTVSGCPVVVDSSKHPSLAFALAGRGDIDLRLIRTVRDPRAVAYSWAKVIERPDAGEHGAPTMRRYPPARTAALWLGHNASLTGLRRFGVPMVTVRHEDVVTDPARELRRIADLAGLPADVALPVSADKVAHLTASHTVSGNPMRFRTGDVRVVADQTWQTETDCRTRATVTALSLPLLHHFGYPVRAGAITR